MHKDDVLPLAVSMGDPAGIGLDITVIAWAMRQARGLQPFVVFGDPATVAARASQLGLSVSVREIIDVADTARHFQEALPVLPVALAQPAQAGRPNAAAAPAIVGSIEQAVAAVVAGTASALVTNPIAKSVLYDAGFTHPGHTEFLGELASRHYAGRSFRPVMMLACDILRVVPLTIHVPLASVPQAITSDLIRETVQTTVEALQRDFAIAQPRVAVCGLNPHAGENGGIGREEIDVIAPAIASLRSEGLTVTGPHSADTLFHAAARETYDVVICMYHDQALIPIKTLAFDEGVNVTLGLPFVRTSPDHGTAFALAGTGQASPESFIASCKMASAMTRRRRAWARSSS